MPFAMTSQRLAECGTQSRGDHQPSDDTHQFKLRSTSVLERRDMQTAQYIKHFAAARVRDLLQRLAGSQTARYSPSAETPVQTFYHGKLFDPLKVRSGLKPIQGLPPSGLAPHECDISALPLDGIISFELDSDRSYFGDCINVVDVPDERPLDSWLPAFGWSGAPLLEGFAMTAASLAGTIALKFFNRTSNSVDFELTQGEGLRGRNSVLAAPNGYLLRVCDNRVRDTPPRSRGRVDLRTGKVRDFHYNVTFENSAITTLLDANPGLVAPPLLFPGLPHAGHAIAWLVIDSHGRLEFGIAAEQFLPLGTGPRDHPITFPPSEQLGAYNLPFRAANSSLHPYLLLIAYGPRVDDIPKPLPSPFRTARKMKRYISVPHRFDRLRKFENRTVRLRCLPADTNFGDDFDLHARQLGGGALAHSPLFGDLVIQFGAVIDSYAPFAMRFDVPADAFRRKFERLMALLPPGTTEGLVGLRGFLDFPQLKYLQSELSLNTDPYKPSVGVVDMRTGRCWPFVLRKYLFQNVMGSLLSVEPRTPTDSFAYLSSGQFETMQDGSLWFCLEGELNIPYPAGYAFPLPKRGAIRIEEGATLRPFVNLVALDATAFHDDASRIRFVSISQRRGERSFDRATLDVGRDVTGNPVVALTLNDEIFTGSNCHIEYAQAGNDRVWFIKFETASARTRRRSTFCFCALTAHAAGAELQIISTDESLDLWMSGLCDVST